MTSPRRKVDIVTPGSRSPFGFNTSADIPSDGSPMQYDRVACSCHTALTLVSGQKHWKCDCHRGPFYKVATMLTMATRPTMGSPLRWVRASSGFTLNFYVQKIPLLTRPALTSKMEFGGPIVPEHCIGLSSCHPVRHSLRYRIALLP